MIEQHAQKIGEIEATMKADPFDVFIEYQAWCDNELCKFQMIDSLISELIKIDAWVFQDIDRIGMIGFLFKVKAEVELPHKTRTVSLFVTNAKSNLNEFQLVHIVSY